MYKEKSITYHTKKLCRVGAVSLRLWKNKKNIIISCNPLDTLVSGSPILQNGKLIGAVTHVLVDDLTRDNAIFAENMLETAQVIAECNR